MKIHLNYDGSQQNGIVFNALYNGVMFFGEENKPDIGASYSSFMFTEVFNQQNYVIETDGSKRIMTKEEELLVADLCNSWVQPLGQEGNPRDLELEVCMKEGKYLKHVNRKNGDMTNFIGCSFIDPDYHVSYANANASDCSFISVRSSGLKKYFDTSKYPLMVCPDILNAYSSNILNYSENVKNYSEYYLGFYSSKEVIDFSKALGLPVPYTNEIIELINNNKYIYKTNFATQTFILSIRIDDDGMPSNLCGYLTLGVDEVVEHLNVDVSSYIEPSKIVHSITPRQARLQLNSLGLLQRIPSLIDSLSVEQKDIAQIEWDYATEFVIWNPFISQMCDALSIDKVTFFQDASKL